MRFWKSSTGVKAGIESFEVQSSRMLRRLHPGRN